MFAVGKIIKNAPVYRDKIIRLRVTVYLFEHVLRETFGTIIVDLVIVGRHEFFVAKYGVVRRDARTWNR